MNEKKRAKRNRTLVLSDSEIPLLKSKLLQVKDLKDSNSIDTILDKTINSNLLEVIDNIPDAFADLIIIDPPYNLTKNFNGLQFTSKKDNEYEEYLLSWFPRVCKKLKDNGSMYVCGDWKSTSVLQRVIETELTILNRITWQREKGRGAKKQLEKWDGRHLVCGKKSKQLLFQC